jgi:hypothetical protein
MIRSHSSLGLVKLMIKPTRRPGMQHFRRATHDLAHEVAMQQLFLVCLGVHLGFV